MRGGNHENIKEFVWGTEDWYRILDHLTFHRHRFWEPLVSMD